MQKLINVTHESLMARQKKLNNNFLIDKNLWKSLKIIYYIFVN